MKTILFPDLRDYSIVLDSVDFKKLFAKHKLIDVLIVSGEKFDQRAMFMEMIDDEIVPKILSLWTKQKFSSYHDSIFAKDTPAVFQVRITRSLLLEIQKRGTYEVRLSSFDKLFFYDEKSIDGILVKNIYNKGMSQK